MKSGKVYALIALNEMFNRQHSRMINAARECDDSTMDVLDLCIEEKDRIQDAIEWVKRQTGK